MTEEGSKSEGSKGSDSPKGDTTIHHFEGKASGDQGVYYLQPLGTQDNNPFNPPQQPSSQDQPSDSPSSAQSGGDSSPSSAPGGESPESE